MKQGSVEKKIIEECVRTRQPLPDTIKNAPSLFLGLDLYYMAFLDLTSCRGQGYGTEGPISWLSINKYCRENGIIGEQREDLIHHVQQMDNSYLAFKAEKLRAQINQPQGKK